MAHDGTSYPLFQMTSAQTPFVLIVMPSTSTPISHAESYKTHAKRIYGDIITTAGQSKIISALPLGVVLEHVERIGWKVVIGLLVVLLPVLAVAGNVFRQVVSFQVGEMAKRSPIAEYSSMITGPPCSSS